MVRTCSENDITNNKQTEKIQKGNVTRVSGGHNNNHAVVTAGIICRYRRYWVAVLSSQIKRKEGIRRLISTPRSFL